MTPINLKIESASQKKILCFLIAERIKVNYRQIRLDKDLTLVEYYSKQNNDLRQLLNQLQP
jgi:hypothetical protein